MTAAAANHLGLQLDTEVKALSNMVLIAPSA